MAKGETTAPAAEKIEEEVDEGPFNCDKCDAIFSNEQQLQSHKIHGHPKNESTKK